jgi:ATP-dependent DNA ligase
LFDQRQPHHVLAVDTLVRPAHPPCPCKPANDVVPSGSTAQSSLSSAPAVIHFSSHVDGHGAQVSEAGSKLGVEGMVSKQVDKLYLPGNRSVWVKTKFLNRQEFVIVGWTDPEGSRSSLGSLLLGYYRETAS